MRVPAWAAAGCATLLAGAAWAQRPSDEDIFGGAADSATATGSATSTGTSSRTGTATTTTTTTATTTATATATITATATATDTDVRDQINLGNPQGAGRFSNEVAPADPLKIGGQFYWRAMSTAKQDQKIQNWAVSAPALLDVFMDARPNERVRAFVLGRMFYDPTLPPSGSATSSVAGVGSVSAQTNDFLGSTLGQQTRGPTVLLDQLWLRADILHTIFVTAGKQHVRWGTARFWTPTDYLHMVPRNPLLPFDSRTGTTMLKLHLPWEERGWNFYAYAIPEGVDATPTTGDVAAAARAEVVLGTMEVGLGAFTQRYSKPKFAGDVSFGLWDLDFYGEAALRNAADVDRVGFRNVQFTPDQVPNGAPPTYTTNDTSPPLTVDPSNFPSVVDAFFPVHRGSGWKPQVTGGVSYTRRYNDNDTFTVGGEYFYNALGYDDPRVYPGVLFLPHAVPLANPATFFYLGRHYLAVYATAPAPFSWDLHTFSLSNLVNLSDKSGITRLDYSLVALTHLRFEAYGAVHWGQRNGEFRFGLDGSALSNTGIPAVDNLAQALTFPPAVFDVGVGLRVAL